MSNLKQTLYEGQWLRLVRIGHWESCERTHAQGMAVIVIAVLGFLLFVEPAITLAWIVFLGLIGTLALRTVTGRLRRYGLQQQRHRNHQQRLWRSAKFGGLCPFLGYHSCTIYPCA